MTNNRKHKTTLYGKNKVSEKYRDGKRKIKKNFQQTTGSKNYSLYNFIGCDCNEYIVVDRYTVLGVEQ